MKIIKMTAFVMLVIIIGVNALSVFENSCKSDGSLKLVLKADSKAKIYTNETEIKAGQDTMPGSWDIEFFTQSATAAREYATFQSEENILTAKRPYPITIVYKETQEDGSKNPGVLPLEVECPGLTFSCKNLNLTIESCENQKDGLFRASLNINGLEQSEAAKMDVLQVIDFILEAENKYKDMTGKETTRGALPAKAQVIRLEKDKYVVRYEFSSKNNNTVKTLWAGYNNNLRYPCKQDKNPETKFYDKIECKTDEAIEQNETPVQTEEKPAVEEQKKETAPVTGKTAEQIIQEKQKNYKPLAIVSIILIVVLSIGGVILSYLYKRGYL